MTGSPYKERLASMRPGEEVVVRGPFGNFLLDTSREPVMLAGGVGISPFRGMIRYVADTHLETLIVLVYANSVPEEIAFREELEGIARNLGSLRIVNTITRPDESSRPWTGRTGRIDPDVIRESTHGLHDALYYVCGTPGFVDSLVGILIEQMDVDERDIRLERFLGY